MVQPGGRSVFGEPRRMAGEGARFSSFEARKSALLRMTGCKDAGASGLMGKITGFLEIDRHDRKYAPVGERIKSYREFVVPLSEKDTRDQAARCMNCGIPYCHGTGSVAPGTPGCPVNNQIPDFNDLVYAGNWEEASRNLHSTNNFPEFTGRICPAPCEASCTLNIDDNPVTIKTIECAIVDRAWDNGWVKPKIAATQTGKKIAVFGSGPAGLACAQQLARAGHDVHLFEKFAKAGGLLRYGIPDFKMEKHIIDRRVAQMEAEGVTFHYGRQVGGNSSGAIDPREMLNEYDALALTGGGDTGSDCIGTSFRQGALSVTQLEIMAAPPEHENKGLTWPNWPLKMRTSSSQAEGAKREYAVLTQRFSGEDGKVAKLHCVQVDEKFKPIAGTEFEIDAQLVLLAMGFVHPVHEGLLKTLGVELDPRGNVRANPNDYQTSLSKVFSPGEMRRGQSLVVWAIREGRLCARSIDTFLMGSTGLPR